jgi:hypothetical protein
MADMMLCGVANDVSAPRDEAKRMVCSDGYYLAKVVVYS